MPSRAKPLRQSVTIPAEQDADRKLNAAYHRFMKEPDPARKEQTGKDLMRAIFEKDAIAGDTPL